MDPLFAIAIFVTGLAFGSFLNVCIYRLPRRILLQDELEDTLRRSQESGVGSPRELSRQSSGLANQLDLGAPATSEPVPLTPDSRLSTPLAEELKRHAEELRAQIANSTISRPKRSFCPSCGTHIAAYDNIPVVSWLVLRGKCRQCQARISPRYLAVEVFAGLLFLACYARFGLTLSTVKFCALSFLLLGLIFTDAEHKLLPDGMTLTGLVIGLGFSLFVPVNDFLTVFLPGMVPASASASWRWLSLADAVLGALVGATFIYGAAVLYRSARGMEGMGGGDVKLMAMVGAFLGVKLTVLTIFGASLAGSIVGVSTILNVWMKRTRRRMARNRESAATARKRAWQSAKMVYRHYQMPFGIFLGGMAMVSLFFGHALLRWYWSLYL